MQRSLSLMLSLSLAACAVGPDYRPPSLSFASAPVMQGGADTADHAWWTAFGDPLLDQLVMQAEAQNPDIAAATARVLESRAEADAAQSSLFPHAASATSAERDQLSLHTPIGAVAQETGLPRDYSLIQSGAMAAWEVDLFGGLRRTREAARDSAEAAKAERESILLSMAAETVDAYVHLRGLQAQLQIATDQTATQDRRVALIRQRRDQGLSSDRDLNRAIGQQQQSAAMLPPLRAAIMGQIDRIDILTGQPAGRDAYRLATIAPIPNAPTPLGTAEPAFLMRRRPDVVAAERQLAAANARIGVAIADYYPHISITGLAGVASFGAANLMTGDALQATGSGALRWRLFDFGRVDADVAAARGGRAAALAHYRAILLQATADVAVALTDLQADHAEIAVQDQALGALTQSRDQAQQAYDAGLLTRLDVLEAEQVRLEAALRQVIARMKAARATVAAIRALGGGWKEGDADGQQHPESTEPRPHPG